MLSALLLVQLCSAEDRRLDPFQFNLCIWNLEGFDPKYSGKLLGSREDDEDTIASVMYSRLSTCDMFVLPGLRNKTTSENLVKAMGEHDFKGFQRYPRDGNYDSTVLSRIDLEEPTPFQPNEFTYPIANSKCGYTGPSQKAMMNLSFYSHVDFHDPVPKSHVISVRLKSGSSAEDCAWREAQADLLCKTAKANFAEGDHVYIAGSFEADASEPYNSVLESCGFSSTMDKAAGKESEHYTRELRHGNVGQKVVWDMVYVNEALKNAKYIDQLVFIQDEDTEKISLTDYTSPIVLYVHQPLTPRWKAFEITYSSILVPAGIAFFTFFMMYSRVKPEEDKTGYDHIGET